MPFLYNYQEPSMKQHYYLMFENGEFTKALSDELEPDTLEAIRDENIFLIRTEVVRDNIEFRKAIVDEVEGGDGELEISDWELI